MRRSVLLSLLAGAALFAAACSSDNQSNDPAGPTLEPGPDAESSFVLRCRDNGPIVLQLAAILSPKPPRRLLQKAIEKFALVQVALLTRRKTLAQTRALDLIDFLADNRANLINPESPTTLTRLGNVTDAILCVVGLPPIGTTLDPNTGIGVVPANNPAPVIITTPQGDAGIKVPTGGAPDEDVNGNPILAIVVTVKALGTNSPLNTPLDQYGQTIDLTASQDVEWQAGGVTVAICVTEDLLDALFDRLRIGHEGGDVENRFGAIEILAPADQDDIGDVVGGCTTNLGSRSAFDGLKHFAKRLLLPDALHAAALVKTGGVGGLASKFSKFGPVDPQLDVIGLPTSTAGTAGEPVAQPPSVLIRTKTQQTAIPGITVGFAVGAGDGSIEPAAVTTNSAGVAATTSWTLSLGQNTAIATPVAPVTEITFTPPSVTFTAQGAPPPPEFGASDWSYLTQSSAPGTTSWTTLPWPVTEAGWAQAVAPFGSVSPEEQSPTQCDDQAPTDWPVTTVILLRRDFFVPLGIASAAISVKIDNDVRVFLNGSDVSGGTIPHEGCGEDNLLPPFIVNAGSESPLIPGAVNRLAVLGIDRGTESFVDAQVTLE